MYRKPGGGVNSAFDVFLDNEPTFYSSVSKALLRIVSRSDVSPYEVEDLVGEAWLEAVQHRDQFEGEDIEPRLSCWLRTTVRRKMSDWLRHHGLLAPVARDVAKFHLLDKAWSSLVAVAEQEEELRALLAKGRVGHEFNDHLVRERFFEKRSIKGLADEFKMSEKGIACRIRRHLRYLRSLVN